MPIYLRQYLKYTENGVYLQLLCKHFNIFLESGIFQEVWDRDTILPMYDNYRGITLLSCMGKLLNIV